MGYDFSRGKDYFRFSYQGWWDVFTLAIGCGWEPTGTGPPRDVLVGDWEGTYFSNDGQRLYARDAKRLAAVLQDVVDAQDAASLDFVPARLRRWHRSSTGEEALCGFEDFQKLVSAVNGVATGITSDSAEGDEPWFLTDEGKECLRDFIGFCMGGSFRIY